MTTGVVDFDIAIATISAGLLALMFTALQVRDEAWKKPLRRAAAAGFLFELLIVMIVALLEIAPGEHREFAAVIGAGIGLVSCASQLNVFLRHKGEDPFDRFQFFGIFFSVGIYLTLLLLGLWPQTARGGVPYVLIWLCFSGSTEIGGLLMWPGGEDHQGDVQTASPTAPKPEAH